MNCYRALAGPDRYGNAARVVIKREGETIPQWVAGTDSLASAEFIADALNNHRGAVEAERKRMRDALLDYATGHSQGATTLMLRALEAADSQLWGR